MTVFKKASKLRYKYLEADIARQKKRIKDHGFIFGLRRDPPELNQWLANDFINVIAEDYTRELAEHQIDDVYGVFVDTVINVHKSIWNHGLDGKTTVDKDTPKEKRKDIYWRKIWVAYYWQSIKGVNETNRRKELDRNTYTITDSAETKNKDSNLLFKTIEDDGTDYRDEIYSARQQVIDEWFEQHPEWAKANEYYHRHYRDGEKLNTLCKKKGTAGSLMHKVKEEIYKDRDILKERMTIILEEKGIFL